MIYIFVVLLSGNYAEVYKEVTKAQAIEILKRKQSAPVYACERGNFELSCEAVKLGIHREYELKLRQPNETHRVKNPRIIDSKF